ncbi:swi snf chromatin remodeling complex component [Diplodia corticola]|uniref:Swi snf chromatin remodeling complex component n=1 Tax=Diplodia corticola TaxID=236234 RepID=A0A1J9QUT6_9PEZI|nr:swi snf chromatin remodeling complex component [Diplodia corticola]OJD32200.1 swi snf chromatin remodeling complex component [Diplodia corticola]
MDDVATAAEQPAVPSSTMQREEDAMQRAREKRDAAREQKLARERRRDVDGGPDAVDTKFKALEYLLSQSKLYSSIMLAQMQQQEQQESARDEKAAKREMKREEKAEKVAEEGMRRATRTRAGVGEVQEKKLPTRGKARGKKAAAAAADKKGAENKISSYFKKEDVEAKAGKTSVSDALQEAAEADVKSADVGIQNLRSARQPGLVTGGTMRSYQLEGLEWLTSLYENGLNGILADEMGLGKTIQTIAFLAFLREKGVYGPFLIAAPLSTTMNWVEEVRKWAPTIPVVLYHGSKQDREQIRQTRLKNPGSPQFPIVVTSYEICMNDRKFLANFGWKFIIIDEGHRIKNLNCRLIRELQSYQSANRLLITGTPLQNNLQELWSLLHFLMPTIFDKLESFESWFDFSALKDRQGYEQIFSEERKQKLVASLHAILKPFLLRRVKADVEKLMPRKREYILYAPLTPLQRELYQAILDGTSRQYLEDKAVEQMSSNTGTPRSSRSTTSLKRKAINSDLATPNKSTKTSREVTPASAAGSGRSRRRAAAGRKTYEEVSDTKYFRELEAATEDSDATPESRSTPDTEVEEEDMRAATLAMAKRQIGAKKLQNPVMQLRLCCDSPYNFFSPFVDPTTGEEGEPDETLVTTSGKMLLLDALLPRLFDEGHKVLIFSQFKTQLDLLESYAEELRGWRTCRIDGSVKQEERQKLIKAFNKPSTAAASPAPAPASSSKQNNNNTPTSKSSKPKPKPKPSRRTTTSSSKKPRREPSPPDVDDDDDDEAEDPPPANLFLLSTRAGGQGINLAAADTVVLFDSDWNPQQDLQAQDRAHRIGQTRNVLVYRLATRNTVETQLLDAAEGKRRLEKLVIRKGGLTRGGGGGGREDREGREELEELQRLLRREDGVAWDVGGGGGLLGEEELRILTDRREEAYDRAEEGVDVGGEGRVFRAVEQKGDGALLEGLKA